jgi:putative ABC transport system permease protein
MVAAMGLAPAQQVFGRSGRVDQIMLLAKPGADLHALRGDLGRVLDGIGIVGSPGDSGGGSFNFAFMQAFTNMVGGFMVLAALMLVFHTMSTATAERRTEIALARSLGSSRRQLLAVTLAEAGLLGVAGTIIGLVLGATLAELVVPLTRYMFDLGSPVDPPAHIAFQAGPAVVAAVAGIAGALVGAVLPARSAARAAPIDAFRPSATYEWRDPTRSRHVLARAAAGIVLVIVGIVLAFRRPADGPDDPTVLFAVFAVYIGAFILVPTTIPFAARGAAALLGRLSPTTGRLAADSLRTNPRRTTINVSALLIPVAAVALTAVAFGSTLTGISRLARGVVGAPLNVDADSYVGVLGGSVASQPLAPDDQSVLEEVPGVRAVLPYQNANIRLPDGGPGIIYAVPLTAAQRAGVADMVTFPRIADDAVAFTRGLAAGEIAASRTAARSLGLKHGSRVTLPTPAGPRAFRVSALFDDWAFDGTFAIDLDRYRAIWGDEDAYRYAIVPSPGASLQDLRHRLDVALTKASMPAEVHTRDQAVQELKSNTTIFLPLARGMTLASLIFAALALGNAAFTAVTEQRWMLALQQALGMSRRRMARSLALEAVAVGVIGAVGGSIVGTGIGVFGARALAYNVALKIDYAVPFGLIAVSTVLGVVVAVGSTYYPRRMARRIPIIEALRLD